MNLIKITLKDFFTIIALVLLLIFFFLRSPILQAIEMDLTVAQNAVGKRFASKFCEAKQEGLSSDISSEFALNNTYLKFVAFPDDEKFIEDLWEFTISKIRKDCGNDVTENDERKLRQFFQEEGEIARNRDLYLPH